MQEEIKVPEVRVISEEDKKRYTEAITEHLLLREKKNWGPGEWQEELDDVCFIYRGLTCVIHRNLFVTGSLNGYVFVPRNNPWVKGIKEYDDLQDLDVHGGVTYGEWGENITRFPYLNAKKDMYVIGFDTAHSGDIAPRMLVFRKLSDKMFETPPHIQEMMDKYRLGDTYKNIKYVENELRSVVDQLLDTKPMKRIIKKKEKLEIKDVDKISG